MARKKQNTDKQDREILESNVRELAKTRAGKGFLWYILDICGINSISFTGNSETFYREGRRSVGVDILELMQDSDPKMYPKLLLEKQEIHDD